MSQHDGRCRRRFKSELRACLGQPLDINHQPQTLYKPPSHGLTPSPLLSPQPPSTPPPPLWREASNEHANFVRPPQPVLDLKVSRGRLSVVVVTVSFLETRRCATSAAGCWSSGPEADPELVPSCSPHRPSQAIPAQRASPPHPRRRGSFQRGPDSIRLRAQLAVATPPSLHSSSENHSKSKILVRSGPSPPSMCDRHQIIATYAGLILTEPARR